MTRDLKAVYAHERIEEVIRAVVEDALSPSLPDVLPWHDEVRFETDLRDTIREITESTDRLLAERLTRLLESASPRAGRPDRVCPALLRPVMTAAVRRDGRHRRRRVRRRRLRPEARRPPRSPRHADRSQRLPPVPAAPLPGRDVDAGRRVTSPTRCARSRPSTTGFETKRAEVVAIDPVARTRDDATRRDLHRRLPRPGRRLAAELLRDARGASTPSRSTPSTTPSASRRGSSRPSRRPTATRASSTRAPSTSSSSAAVRPGSRSPAPCPR